MNKYEHQMALTSNLTVSNIGCIASPSGQGKGVQCPSFTRPRKMFVWCEMCEMSLQISVEVCAHFPKFHLLLISRKICGHPRVARGASSKIYFTIKKFFVFNPKWMYVRTKYVVLEQFCCISPK